MYRIEVYDVTGGDWILLTVARSPSSLAAARLCEHHRRLGRAARCWPPIPLDERRAAHGRND